MGLVLDWLHERKPYKNLFPVFTVATFLLFLFNFIIECIGRHTIDSKDSLVWIFHNHKLTIVQTHELINEHLDGTPHIRLHERDLARKLMRFVELCGQDNVMMWICSVFTRNIADLHLLGTSNYGLCCPLRKFVRVVLEFGCQDGTTLHVNLLTPFNSARKLRIPFVQRIGSHVLLFTTLRHSAMQLTTCDQLYVAQCELAVPIGNRGWFHARRLFGIVERIRHLHLFPFRTWSHIQDLLSEILVDG
mmetsp:Transcript_14426/g.19234  ORF Transcript_14426/g.19234 Transcript_14426/m.19234 type:complete len:247 (+) Transcript_14426:260-1000(+)